MKNHLCSLVALAATLGVATAETQHKYDTWEENFNVQALLGAVQFENFKFTPDDSATPREVDLSLLPQLGGAWTTRPRGDRFQYGLETSFLIGFQTDEINYLSAGGSGLHVNLSTSLWMVDFAGGAYASLFLDPGRKVRLYAAGGPLAMYADYRADRTFSDDSEDEDEGETAFGIGFYARTGIEFRVHERGMLGLGARGTWSNIDFTDIGGHSELVGIAGFATYTAGF